MDTHTFTFSKTQKTFHAVHILTPQRPSHREFGLRFGGIRLCGMPKKLWKPVLLLRVLSEKII